MRFENSQLHNTKRIKKNFARNLPKVKVEDVKTKLSCETSLQKWELKMWKRSFCARLPSKTNSLKLSKWSLNCQLQRAADPRMITITAGTVSQPPRGQASPSIFRGTFWPAKHNISCIRYLSKTHLVRAFPQKVKAEDVKTKLSCEIYFPFTSWRCENEAFVRDFPPQVKVEDVKMKLSCETPLTNWKLKMWKRSFCARLPSKTNSLKLSKWSLNCQLQCAADPRWSRSPPGPSRNRRADKLPHPSSEARFDLQNTTFRASAISQRRISCEPSLKKWKLKMWKRSFRARFNFPSQVEDVKTKLSCETSLHKWKLKMWKRSFRARLPHKLKVEDVKTKLLCETSIKKL